MQGEDFILIRILFLQAELHLHIEGTFEPDQMLEIAARNSMLESLPFKDLAAAKLAYQFQDLQSFLDIYYAGCAVLLHEKVPNIPQATSRTLSPLKIFTHLRNPRPGRKTPAAPCQRSKQTAIHRLAFLGCYAASCISALTLITFPWIASFI